jgi:hypothetical protein
VLDLTTMNKSLLCKWLWKLENTEGTWQTMLSMKYLPNQVLSQARMGLGALISGKVYYLSMKIFNNTVRE